MALGRFGINGFCFATHHGEAISRVALQTFVQTMAMSGILQIYLVDFHYAAYTLWFISCKAKKDYQHLYRVLLVHRPLSPPADLVYVATTSRRLVHTKQYGGKLALLSIITLRSEAGLEF